MDQILLSLTYSSREEGLLSVFQTAIPSVGYGPAEKQILMIISFSKFHSSGFPGRRERSWCKLVDLLTFFQIRIGHKFMGSQTALLPLFLELLALCCGGFKKIQLCLPLLSFCCVASFTVYIPVAKIQEATKGTSVINKNK